jgi:diguanylate cyclase (GGDEF)-like protein/PAS domain S-box-containing protein
MSGESSLCEVLSSLFDGNPDAIFVYDVDGRMFACNEAAVTLTGYSLDDIRDRHFADHVALDDREKAERAFAGAVHGAGAHFETTIRTRGGPTVPVECHVFSARAAGCIVGAFGQVRDMTALRSAEQSLHRNQERLRSLFEYHPDAIATVQRDGRISHVNGALEMATGYAGEQLVGRGWDDLIAPRSRDNAAAAFLLAAAGEPVEFDAFLLDRAGKEIDIQMKLVPIRVDEAVDGLYAIAKNMTSQRIAERAVTLQSERIRDLYLAAASRGSTISSQIDMTLAYGCRLFGFDYGYVGRFENHVLTILNAVGEGSPIHTGEAYARDATLSRFLSAENDTLLIPDLDEAPWSTDVARRNASWRSYLAARLVVNDRDFGVLAFTGRMPRGAGAADMDRDLLQLMALFVAAALERSQNAQRIEQMAFYDSLTGLPNRVLFADRLGQILSAARRYRRRFAVMYLDLDDFKTINDGHGHAMGDLVLRTVGERLSALLRESDTLARFGGDEFVLLQPLIAGQADAADLAQKIVIAMQEPLAIGKAKHIIHTSIGIALYPEDGASADALMTHADQALYRAKRDGRNGWCFFVNQAETAESSRRS